MDDPRKSHSGHVDEDDDAAEPLNHATRFGAGQKRNALGRPKGSKGMHTIVRKVANQRTTVTEGNLKKRRSWLEILLITIRNNAMVGDERWIVLFDRALSLSKPQDKGPALGVLIVPEQSRTIEEWEQKYATQKPGL